MKGFRIIGELHLSKKCENSFLIASCLIISNYPIGASITHLLCTQIKDHKKKGHIGTMEMIVSDQAIKLEDLKFSFK